MLGLLVLFTIVSFKGGESMPLLPDRPRAGTVLPASDLNHSGTFETATFALGWFWGPDSQFGSLPGVIRTRVGYAGGTTTNPTYHDLGDHSETIQIDFDPSRISYRELLNIFWKSHDPTSGSWSRQYRQAIFYQNEQQRKEAIETRDKLASETGRRITTAIEPYSGFYLAEDYHQKHSLRSYPEILAEFRVMFPDLKSMLNSTAVTLVNGYLGGNGSCDSLKKEIESFGLSIRAKETLTFAVCGHKASISCPMR